MIICIYQARHVHRIFQSWSFEQSNDGWRFRYHCKDGYSLNAFHGQEIYRCLANGEWSPRVPPVCISLETGLAGHDDPLEQV